MAAPARDRTRNGWYSLDSERTLAPPRPLRAPHIAGRHRGGGLCVPIRVCVPTSVITASKPSSGLRAVRAASELAPALEGLNAELEARHGVRLELRIGVHTGEVVAVEASVRQSMVSGDTVNTAARLEAAARASMRLAWLRKQR